MLVHIEMQEKGWKRKVKITIEIVKCVLGVGRAKENEDFCQKSDEIVNY